MSDDLNVAILIFLPVFISGGVVVGCFGALIVLLDVIEGVITNFKERR
jgi:hypothetical protein